MKILISGFLFLCCTAIVWADMPGNKPRMTVVVYVHLGNLEGYSIYTEGTYSSDYKSIAVKDSYEHVLQGGFGAPPCIAFFGVNNIENHTDTLVVCNEEQGNVQLTLSVHEGKLISDEKHAVKEEDATPVSSGENSNSHSSFFSNPTNILILSAFAALLLLIGLYFLVQRKKQAV